MPLPNQIGRKRDDVHVTARDLLAVPDGSITEKGLRWNIDGALHLERADRNLARTGERVYRSLCLP